LLPRAALHSSRNRASYEFYAASRPEQYFGELRWDLAGPLLQQRLGTGTVTWRFAEVSFTSQKLQRNPM
jgi:hypothetical protein